MYSGGLGSILSLAILLRLPITISATTIALTLLTPLPSMEEVKPEGHKPDILSAYSVVLSFKCNAKKPIDRMCHRQVSGAT